MTEKKAPYNLNDAREMIVQERKERTAACWGEIEKVLEKHACDLTGEPVFMSGPSGHVVRVNIWVSARED